MESEITMAAVRWKSLELSFSHPQKQKQSKYANLQSKTQTKEYIIQWNITRLKFIYMRFIYCGTPLISYSSSSRADEKWSLPGILWRGCRCCCFMRQNGPAIDLESPRCVHKPVVSAALLWGQNCPQKFAKS